MNILVTAARGATLGRLRFDGRNYVCALGRAGILSAKCEGDGGTPVGTFPLRELRYRADRLAKPATVLSAIATEAHDGWCDASTDASYNRLVRLPYPASAETLWREDHLYDLLIVMGYNDAPVAPGAGSAIFFHLAKKKDGVLQPTEGCVALDLADMLAVLAQVTPATCMTIALDENRPG
jgi:L,D-peptidoglycan transpeptidase YkuD (ErfK/YbiS/YcfS/YnhG family)